MCPHQPGTVNAPEFCRFVRRNLTGVTPTSAAPVTIAISLLRWGGWVMTPKLWSHLLKSSTLTGKAGTGILCSCRYKPGCPTVTKPLQDLYSEYVSILMWSHNLVKNILVSVWQHHIQLYEYGSEFVQN